MRGKWEVGSGKLEARSSKRCLPADAGKAGFECSRNDRRPKTEDRSSVPALKVGLT